MRDLTRRHSDISAERNKDYGNTDILTFIPKVCGSKIERSDEHKHHVQSQLEDADLVIFKPA